MPMGRPKPARWPESHYIVLELINSGVTELDQIQTLAADVGIPEGEAYRAARFLRMNGHVKGVKAPYRGREYPNCPTFRWTYAPLTAEDLAMRKSSTEAKLEHIRKTISELELGRKPAPVQDDSSSD
jgi:hypothetical protein